MKVEQFTIWTFVWLIPTHSQTKHLL